MVIVFSMFSMCKSQLRLCKSQFCLCKSQFYSSFLPREVPIEGAFLFKVKTFKEDVLPGTEEFSEKPYKKRRRRSSANYRGFARYFIISKELKSNSCNLYNVSTTLLLSLQRLH